MKNSCVIIPNAKNSNNPSSLFKELLGITNRESAKALYAITKDEALLETLNLPIDREPNATELLDSLKNVDKILNSENYAKYAMLKENLKETTFPTFDSALAKANYLLSNYQDLTPSIKSSNEGFFVRLKPKTAVANKEFAEQVALGRLNRKLLNYMNSLGFTVKEIEGLETPGKFSPEDAMQTADDLKEVIQITKGEIGQKALPEEFAHLIIEGLRNTPLISRLLNTIDRVSIIDYLGEEYNVYVDKYDNDLNMLRREVAAKILAQYIVNRAGLEGSLSYISNRALNLVSGIFSQGNASDVNAMQDQHDASIKEILESFFGEKDIVNLIDTDSIMTSKSLYALNVKAKSMQSMAQDSYEKIAKRLKLLSIQNPDGTLDKSANKAYDEVKKALDKAEYTDSCIHFLNFALEDCIDIYDSIKALEKKMKEDNTVSPALNRRNARLIRSTETAIAAYTDIVDVLGAAKVNVDMLSENLDEEQLDKIEDLAAQVSKVMRNMKELNKILRTNLLHNVFSKYWNEDSQNPYTKESKKLSLQDVLESGISDISSVSRLFNSMSEMSDPLLQLVDILYKDTASVRDDEIFKLQQKLASLMKDYVKSTGNRDTSFMFERDEDGNLTGMLVSPIDYVKFRKAKSEYLKELKDSGASNKEISLKLKIWNAKNTDQVTITQGNLKRKERRPKLSIYKKDNPFAGWSTAQKNYYNDMMEIKKSLDFLIPSRSVLTYRAPQKKIGAKDAIFSGKNPKVALKHFKDSILESVDDTGFGEEVYDKKGYKMLDFSGNEVKKIPIYYNTFLDDMSLLDTNLSESLLSYGAMAHNYKQVSAIADVAELVHSHMSDRKVIQTSGLNRMFERFKPKGDDVIQNDYMISGVNTEATKKVRNYIDSNLYDRRKDKEAVNIKGKDVRLDKIGDNLRSYSSLVSMGYNLFSGISNLFMGSFQNFLEAVGHEYFSLKSWAKAHILFFKNIHSVIQETYSDKKSNILSLIIQKYDLLEDNYGEFTNSDLNKNLFKKIISKHNPMILNTMGEFYLRVVPGLAMLYEKEITVKDSNGNEVKKSLMDALSIKEIELFANEDGSIETYSTLELEEGIDFNAADNNKYKSLIHQVVHKGQGAYAQVDRGDINKMVAGRMIMQYRQWMPAFISARFGSSRLNALTGKLEEKQYVTAVNFLLGTLVDAFQFKFNLFTNFKRLSDNQKANIWKTLTETVFYYLIGAMLGGKAPDDDDPALLSYFKLGLYRTKTEIGAFAPISLDVWDNVKTIFKTPVPAMEQMDRLISLLDITNISETVESGKYAGWNVWLRDLYFATPYVKNVKKMIDFNEGDRSIFSSYIK